MRIQSRTTIQARLPTRMPVTMSVRQRSQYSLSLNKKECTKFRISLAAGLSHAC
jgi:hypothetical protein